MMKRHRSERGWNARLRVKLSKLRLTEGLW